MTKITYDISKMVGELSSAKSALSDINNIMGMLTNTVSNLGQAISGSFGQGGNVPSGLVGAAGQPVSSKNNEDLYKAHTRHAPTMEQFRGPQGTFVPGQQGEHVLTQTGELKRWTQTGSGNKILLSTGYSTSIYDQVVAQQRAASVASMTSASANQTSTFSAAILNQYGTRDIPRMLNMAQAAPGVAKSLQDQMARLSGGSVEQQALAKTLESFSQKATEQQKAFQAQYSQYSQALVGGDKAKTDEEFRKLREVMVSLEQTIEDATEVNKEALRGQGDGGGGGPGGLRGFISKWGRSVGAIGGAAVAGYSAYEGFQLARGQVEAGANTRLYSSLSAMESLRSNRDFGRFDLTNPENLIKYKGDVLFGGGASNFLGERGYQASMRAAQSDQEQRLENMRRERNLGFLPAGGIAATGVSAGALMMMSGIGIVPGAITMAGSLAAAAGVAAKNYITSDYTQMSGSMLLSDKATQAARADFVNQTYQSANQFQSMGTDLYKRQQMGLGEILAMSEAERMAAPIVGGRALTRADIIGMSGGIDKNVAKQSLEIRQLEANRFSNQEKIERVTASRDILSKGLMPLLGSEYVTSSYFQPLREKNKELAELKSLDKANNENIQKALTTQTSSGIQISRGGILSELEMSGAEFAGAYAQTLNAMGAGNISKSRGISMTREATLMGRAGLGSFDQILGNMSQLSALTGQQDTSGRLETIMANAVASGFNRSGLAQQFVRTTADLTQYIKTTNTGFVSGLAATGAAQMSITGQANELSLSQAARGVQALEAITSQQGGAMGAAKMMGVYAAGGSMSGVGGAITGMGTIETQSALAELSGGEAGVTTPRLKRMLNALRASGDKNPVATLRKQLSASASGAMDVVNTAIYLTGQGSVIKKTMSEISTLEKGSAAQKEKIQQLIGLYSVAGANTVLGEEGGAMAAISQLREAGTISDVEGSEMLEKQKREGQAVYRDPARQRHRDFVNSLVKSVASSTRGITAQDYITGVRGGAGTRTVDGKEIDADRLDKILKNSQGRSAEDEAYLKSVEKKLSEESAADFAQEYQTSNAGEGVQRVIVENFSTLAVSLMELGITTNLSGKKDIPQNQNENTK